MYIEVNKENVGKRLDQYLCEQTTDLSRTLVKTMIEEEKVLVNGKAKKSSYKIKENDKIETFDIEQKNSEIIAEDIPVDIVYEDDDILIINKEKGVVVHPGNGNKSGTIVNSLLFTHKDNLSPINGVLRPGIVHRIDKDTTGIIVVAKSDNALKRLAEDFKIHNIKREYLGIVRGIVEKDKLKISLPIGRDTNSRIKMAVTKKNSKEAITNITVLQRFYNSNCTLISAVLETGRTHQIRVHMAYIGHPLLGDEVYSNGKNEFGIKGQLLHAKLLGFNHPITKEYVEYIADVPDEFKKVLNILKSRENK